MKLWPPDTIARRFTITIVLAILVAVALTGIVIEFAGVWARPPLSETGLLERADDIVRMSVVLGEDKRLRQIGAPRKHFREDLVAESGKHGANLIGSNDVTVEIA